MSMEELAKKYQEVQSQLCELRRKLDENKDELLQRLQKVCVLLAANTKPTTCCTDDLNMEQRIAKMSLQDLRREQYPASSIEWEIENGKFVVRIEAVFHGELDTTTIVAFPVNSAEFDAYCGELQDKADKRAEVAKQKALAEQAKKEQEERELLKRLQEKYEEKPA